MSEPTDDIPNDRDRIVLPWDRATSKKRVAGSSWEAWGSTLTAELPAEESSDVEKEVLDLSHCVLESQCKEKKRKIERLEKELLDARKSHIKLGEMKRRVTNMIQTVGKQVEDDERKTNCEQEIELIWRQVKEFQKYCIDSFPKIRAKTFEPLLDWTPATFDLSVMMHEWYCAFSAKGFKSHDVFPYLFADTGEDISSCFSRSSASAIHAIIAAEWKVVPHAGDPQLDKYYRENGFPSFADGPARTFFGCLWNQLGSLNIDGVELFQISFGGLVPVDVDFFVGKKSREWYDNNMDRIHRYYRAIGRILAHCLLLGIPIADFVLPRLYITRIFRGVDVTDPMYDSVILLDDVMAVLDLECHGACAKRRLLQRFELKESADEGQLRTKIQQVYFQGPGISSMTEGISLLGTLPLHLCFRLIPTKTISNLLFTRQEITYDMIFDSNGDFRFFHFVQDMANPEESEVYQEYQALFCSAFINWFKEKLDFDPCFICSFFGLVTGMPFIPDVTYQKDFKINVEYNATEMGENLDFLPVVYTCNNTIQIPANAYGGNISKFEEMLRRTMLLLPTFL